MRVLRFYQRIQYIDMDVNNAYTNLKTDSPVDVISPP